MITLAFDHSIAPTGWCLSEPPSSPLESLRPREVRNFVDQNARVSGT
jgi:hypothetical protein